mgnify:CR=1 FL=1
MNDEAAVRFPGRSDGGYVRHPAVDQFDSAVAARRQPRVVGDDEADRKSVV